MDIKLVKNFEEGMYIPVNREILLQIIDDNRRLEQFNGKHIFLFNPANNERFEILPEVPKFNVTKIYYGSEERDYFVFTSAKMINEHETQITFYWYQISLQETFIIHKQIVPTDRLREPDYLKVLVLAQDFCVFETKNGEYGNKDSYSFLLKDVKNNKELEFQNEELGRFGIDKIVPLSGNLCGIKIGNKTIGVINVNQFVSDMVIGLEKITYTDILDNASDTMQLAHMRKYNNTLLYTKRDVSADSEEVVIYDYDNKVKRVRLNSRISEAADFKNICVISGVPYNFLESDKGTRIINLNTQKTEYKLPADVCVEYVQDDIIVTSEHVKKMSIFRKENDFVEVFRFPDMHHAIYKTRDKFKGCIKHFDDLLIFVG
jgi:hypothetical protein